VCTQEHRKRQFEKEYALTKDQIEEHAALSIEWYVLPLKETCMLVLTTIPDF
jgi:hypothetical protein